MPVEDHQIAVVGAAGHTGAFVVAELLARGCSPVAIGRDAALAARGYGPAGVPMRVASTEEPIALDRALDGAAAVINCAGPFLDTADAVASAAMRVGIHYVDVTAEQPSARATLDDFDARARERGVVVIPAMGFFGGLGDLLATVAVGGWPDVDDMLVAVGLDSWHPTEGTRRTGRRNTVRRVVIRDCELTALPDPAPTTQWTFPEPWGRQSMSAVPMSEVPLIARHLPVRRLTTYLNDSALRDLADPDTPPPAAVDPTGRSAQRFAIEVRARAGDRGRVARATGRDIYAVTAPLVVEAVLQVLRGRDHNGGAFAPGQILDAQATLRAIQPDQLSFEITEPSAVAVPA